jgi:hypothetical protein
MRTFIESYLTNKRLWSRQGGSNFGLSQKPDPNAMDIGAIGGKGGKGGKNKPKGGKPAGKGDGKKGDGKKGGKADKGQGKGADGKKGNKDKQPKFDGVCNLCKKHGHKEADCWWKKDKGDVNAVNTSATATSSGGPATLNQLALTNGVTSISGQPRTNGQPREGAIYTIIGGKPRLTDDNGDHFVFAIGSTDDNAANQVSSVSEALVDSGACDNVTYVGAFPDVHLDTDAKKSLFGVEGSPLRVHGTQEVPVVIGKHFDKAGLMKFRVVENVGEHILSIGNMVDNEAEEGFHEEQKLGCH